MDGTSKALADQRGPPGVAGNNPGRKTRFAAGNSNLSAESAELETKGANNEPAKGKHAERGGEEKVGGVVGGQDRNVRKGRKTVSRIGINLEEITRSVQR